jgi:hypothetical protein
MPAKSKKQYGLMQAIAHGKPSIMGNAGPTKAVAREFINKTPAKKRREFSRNLRKKNPDKR